MSVHITANRSQTGESGRIKLALTAGWSPGLIAGAALLVANNRDNLGRQLAYPVLWRYAFAVLLVSVGMALVSGCIFWLFSSRVAAAIELPLSGDPSRAFITVWGIHIGTYVGAAIGLTGAATGVIRGKRRVNILGAWEDIFIDLERNSTMSKNVIVAQSGGPTPVINSSLRGVIETCHMFPETFGTVYAGWHGIEGVLKEELLDLSAQPEEEIALLRYTPSAGSIGTCRYKLKKDQQEDFERVIAVMKAHDIGYFFYNGGNDSMDTAHKVSALAHERGLDLVAVGVPKTIDNDVGDSEFKLIDHTPGYGSVARYWMAAVQNANEENKGSSPADPVLVLQAMGRKIGYIPAAARLADPKREMPLQIYMAESGVTGEQMCDLVSDQLTRDGRCVVVVSEGFDVGDLGFTRDSFGHAQFSASKTTVVQQVINMLNDKGLPVRGSARGQVFGTDQRATAAYASIVDLDEAYKLGQQAALIAHKGEHGYMSTILREPGIIYNVRYDKVPLEKVANSERTFPKEWLSPDKIDVTDEFVRYAKPLIGEDWPSVPVVDGRQRFTQFKPIFADKKLPAYELHAAWKKK